MRNIFQTRRMDAVFWLLKAEGEFHEAIKYLVKLPVVCFEAIYRSGGRTALSFAPCYEPTFLSVRRSAWESHWTQKRFNGSSSSSLISRHLLMIQRVMVMSMSMTSSGL